MLYPAELLGHIDCILPKEQASVKKKIGEWILFHFSSLQNQEFRL